MVTGGHHGGPGGGPQGPKICKFQTSSPDPVKVTVNLYM